MIGLYERFVSDIVNIVLNNKRCKIYVMWDFYGLCNYISCFRNEIKNIEVGVYINYIRVVVVFEN